MGHLGPPPDSCIAVDSWRMIDDRSLATNDAMAPLNSVAKPTRIGLTKVTRSMLGTEMQSAICRRDHGAQSGTADGG
jgi:hypothetical protein